jgi:hypothetical protein
MKGTSKSPQVPKNGIQQHAIESSSSLLWSWNRTSHGRTQAEAADYEIVRLVEHDKKTFLRGGAFADCTGG